MRYEQNFSSICMYCHKQIESKQTNRQMDRHTDREAWLFNNNNYILTNSCSFFCMYIRSGSFYNHFSPKSQRLSILSIFILIDLSTEAFAINPIVAVIYLTFSHRHVGEFLIIFQGSPRCRILHGFNYKKIKHFLILYVSLWCWILKNLDEWWVGRRSSASGMASLAE